LPALANDTSAELSTGGLIFVRNDDVEMPSEDLAISAREVSVRYRFLNRSDKDVTVLVAFPMPDIQVVGPDDITSVPTDDMRRVVARRSAARLMSRETYRRVSIAMEGGASWLMNIGWCVCDLNCHPLSGSSTQSFNRSAISIGGLDCGAGGRTTAP
jgi:hypothetical protein